MFKKKKAEVKKPAMVPVIEAVSAVVVEPVHATQPVNTSTGHTTHRNLRAKYPHLPQ